MTVMAGSGGAAHAECAADGGRSGRAVRAGRDEIVAVPGLLLPGTTVTLLAGALIGHAFRWPLTAAR